MNELRTEQKSHQRTLATTLTMAAMFLLPIVVVPSAVVPFELSKTLMALVFVLVSFALFFHGALTRRTLTLTGNTLLGAVYLLPVAYLVSAAFSSQPSLSFFGAQFEPETFGFVFLGALVTHAVVLNLREKTSVFSALIAFLVGGWVLLVFQVVQVLFSGPLPIFTEPTSNLLGTWSDFGLMAGLLGVLALLSHTTLSLPRVHGLLLSGTVLLSLIFLILVQSTETWTLVVLSSGAIAVFALVQRYFGKGDGHRVSLVLPGVSVIVAIAFLLVGGGIASSAQQLFGIDSFEVRPSLQATAGILSDVYETSPLVGSGPNTFAAQWLLHRAPDVVQTPFWNLAFVAGSSAVTTAGAVGGLVVALAWLAVLAITVVSVVRALFFVEAHSKQTYILTSVTGVGVLYLLAAHLIATPGTALSLTLFLFLGLFIASLNDTRFLATHVISLSDAPRRGFSVVLVGLLVLGVVGGGLVIGGRQYVSLTFHNQAVEAANRGDFEAGYRLLDRAVSVYPSDRYFRTATLMNLAELNALIRGTESDEAAQERFRTLLTSALASSAEALRRDPQNFTNLTTRALVYATVVPLEISGAYENALAVYNEARAVNPLDPEIDLQIAQMEVAREEFALATQALDSALAKKADYTPAILLRAQMALDSGNLDEAITAVKNAVFFEPTNEVLLYQLGILSLQADTYDEAAAAFELALRENDSFANARFFLAQAYAFLGQYNDAAPLMRRLEQENPDNALVREYAEKLEQGENPFTETPVELEEDTEVIE